MSDRMISRDKFEEIFRKCRTFDPFTRYIDSYSQEISAERANKQIIEDLNKMLAEFDLSLPYHQLPMGVDVSYPEKEARIHLLEFFNSNDIHLEPKKEEAKRVWTEDEIKELIQTNDKVLYGALKKLYAEQTADEQSDGQTSHANGAGFNGVDSPFLSSCSEFLLKKGYLTDKQKTSVRKLLVKYNKQLTRLSNM